eukprot:XP_015575166.1 uncharacterized protein LOC107261307 [Ricinus communis]
MADSDNPTNRTSNGDPFLLQGSDHPGMVLVTAPLTGINFLTWSRSMKIALGAKMKLGFVNGKIPIPDEESLEFETWTRVNCMELWDEIAERYGESNGPLLYQLQREISSVSQGNESVSTYYTRLKRLWDEFACLLPLPACFCGASKAVSDLHSMNRLMQFLMGLNDCYNNTKNQILVMEPLPSVNRAYSMMLSVEKQKEVHINFNEHIEGTGLMVKTQGSFQEKPFFSKVLSKKDKEKQQCEHCKQKGHLKESCFKLHGYPDWFKELKDQQKKGILKATTNMVDSPLDYDSEGKEEGKKNRQDDIAILVQQEIQRLMKGKVLTEGNFMNLAMMDGYAGKDSQLKFPLSVASSTANLSETGAWILDTGATNHMIGTKFFFKHLKPPHRPTPVFLPDGTIRYIDSIGNINLENKITLNDVLYIPSFKFNLISVHKLAKTAQLECIFTPTDCTLQDLQTKTILATGKALGSLYILDTLSFKNSKCNQPVSYKQACTDQSWRLAMENELQALEKNGTWDLVELPTDKKAIGCKWVFKLKLKPDGTVDRHKARLVAKGFHQLEGIDYFESFSPVAKIVTVRIFIAIATAKSWPIHQLDINNAFLHGFLKKKST